MHGLIAIVVGNAGGDGKTDELGVSDGIVITEGAGKAERDGRLKDGSTVHQISYILRNNLIILKNVPKGEGEDDRD